MSKIKLLTILSLITLFSVLLFTPIAVDSSEKKLPGIRCATPWGPGCDCTGGGTECSCWVSGF